MSLLDDLLSIDNKPYQPVYSGIFLFFYKKKLNIINGKNILLIWLKVNYWIRFDLKRSMTIKICIGQKRRRVLRWIIATNRRRRPRRKQPQIQIRPRWLIGQLRLKAVRRMVRRLMQTRVVKNRLVVKWNWSKSLLKTMSGRTITMKTIRSRVICRCCRWVPVDAHDWPTRHGSNYANNTESLDIRAFLNDTWINGRLLKFRLILFPSNI